MRTPFIVSRHFMPALTVAVAAVLMALFAGDSHARQANRGVTFTDIAAGDNAGITYRRAPSLSEAEFEAIRQLPIFTIATEQIESPDSSRGQPGVSIFDYDRDGDLDIYVTNGPGAPNSLYANQFVETCCNPTGCDSTCNLTFIDLGVEAGVAATAQDSNGSCYGDIDNDGDHDLLVLGNVAPGSLIHNQLYENQGNGTFTDITAASGLSADAAALAQCGDVDEDNDGVPDNDTGCLTPVSCAMGDIDNDGLLDIAIAQAFDMRDRLATVVVPFEANQKNQLFKNVGGNAFADVSESSGITITNYPPPLPGSTFDAPAPDAPAICWAVSLVDYDLDGDVDLFFAEDQAALPFRRNLGIDRGYIQLYENDGSGQFTNVTIEKNLDANGDWMGFSFGDFDHNGHLDLFSTNLGSYSNSVFFPQDQNEPVLSEQRDSRWFLQQPDGTFADIAEQGANGDPHLVNTPFGWGTSAGDYDNDGDTDIIFHGGFDFGFFTDLSPAVILRNDGTTPDGDVDFRRDTGALALSTNHLLRIVRGMAIGDLNNDGFIDIISVSNHDFPESTPLAQKRQLGAEFPQFHASPLAAQFDADALYVQTFLPIDPTLPPLVTDYRPATGLAPTDGTLSVEINSADNGNGWAKVEVFGTIGLTSGGRVNRDGIGAVLSFTPLGGRPVMQPILGGSSKTSQDGLIANFGLGDQELGHVEVRWPGGVRNKLFLVQAGETILFPEIPCSFDTDSHTLTEYSTCVTTALNELRGLVPEGMRERLFTSAIRAFEEHQVRLASR